MNSVSIFMKTDILCLEMRIIFNHFTFELLQHFRVESEKPLNRVGELLKQKNEKFKFFSFRFFEVKWV